MTSQTVLMEKRDMEREAVLGAHSLDLFSFDVPDLGEAERFFRAFGLDVRAVEGGVEVYTIGGTHRWALIRRGSVKRMREIVFGAYAADMEALYERLRRLAPAGLAREPGGSISFYDPDGITVRIVAAEKSSPAEKSMPSAFAAIGAPGAAAAPLRSAATQVQPRRLAHIMLFVTDVPRAIAFYCDALGLRVSDTSGDVAFLHGPHGSDHHMIAFCRATGAGLHHSSWDVGSVQEVGLGAMQMADRGYGEGGWGLGRHVLGSNYFHYVRDPWNSYAEYSFDIDYVPAGFDWPASDCPPENGFYLWGPKPPPDFGVNYEPR